MGGRNAALPYFNQNSITTKLKFMLEQDGMYNDISPVLREKLEARINTFGRYVRYKFKLERPNPDPTKYNGETIYPSQYNLHPVQWKITDSDETEERIKAGKQRSKNIGVIEKSERDENGNLQYRYTGLRVLAIEKGLKLFDMEKEEDKTMVAALELHPKSGNGMFPDKQMVAVFSRVDEAKAATDERTERTARKKAMDAAELMSKAEVVEFADAMATDEWNSTQEEIFLRNKIERLAETTPVLFNDLVKSEKIKVRATVQRAINNGLLNYNPSEGSLAWASTQQQIIALGMATGEKNDVERFADWMLENGSNGSAVYKKLKSLNEKPAVA